MIENEDLQHEQSPARGTQSSSHGTSMTSFTPRTASSESILGILRSNQEDCAEFSSTSSDTVSTDWVCVPSDKQDTTKVSQLPQAENECTAFPTLPQSVDHPVVNKAIRYEFSEHQFFHRRLPASTLIHAAWALNAGRISNSDNVMFGVQISETNRHVVDIELASMEKPKPLPLRIAWNAKQSISDYLRYVQLRMAEALAHESESQKLPDLSPENETGSEFQTLLDTHQLGGSVQSTLQASSDGYRINQPNDAPYALILEICQSEKGLIGEASFDTRVLEPWLVYRLLQRLDHLMQQLCHHDSESLLGDINVITPQDLQQIWDWNHKVPIAVNRCIHEMIRDRTQSQPDSPAVYAWDGELTYAELDRLSEKVAGHLVDLGIKPDMLVPLCFEKSMWVPVAMLGVLKAGGGFVLLDTSFPEERLRVVVQEVEATLVLSSSSNMPLCLRLSKTAVQVDAESVLNFQANDRGPKSQSSATAMFGVFTSGSTGRPKGAILTHSNYCSVMVYQLEQLGISANSRVFDFASYAFDVSVHNAFATFTSGGCLCIPSEQDRRDNISTAMTNMRATVAHLTPSVTRLIHPDTVPFLETMIFTGEPVSMDDIKRWWGKVRIVNEYGPAECSINTINSEPSSPEVATSIGKGVGVVTWVVDADNHNLLVPPGCVGELLVEGPLVGRGYINNPEKNAASFIENPSWLVLGTPDRPGRQDRLYKTGDLVRQNADQSLIYLGRKDSQVKIRGQRVDLGEVEHWVRDCMPAATQAVAEVILPRSDFPSPTLVAFLQVEEDTKPRGSIDALEARMLPVPKEVEAKLAKHLPTYMVPTIFFSMRQLPMSPTGKMNRKRLREIGSTFTFDQLAQMRTARQEPKRQPSSELEQQIHKIWAKVLNIDTTLIGLDDSFFHLGGDSIAAMKVVGEARRAGIKLTVADIFRHPLLYDLASQSHYIVRGASENIPEFGLLRDVIDIPLLLGEISSQYHLKVNTIRDAYPCTPLQEGLQFLASKRPGDYIEQNVLELAPDLSVDAFFKAWKQVVRAEPILRTRLAHHSNFGLLQLVLEDEFCCEEVENLDQYLDNDRKSSMDLGKPLSRYALVRDQTGFPKYFVWTMHHSIYDGWSVHLIMDAVYRAYRGESVNNGSQFQRFIKYVKEQDEKKMSEYWQKTLGDYDGIPFPVVKSSLEQPVADAVVEHRLPNPQTRREGITTSILIRAAWALVVAQMANTDDVIFGSTLYGRNAPVGGLDELAAPTIATVPVRVRLLRDQKVSEYLETIQQEATEMIPFEQTGLQTIARICPSGQKVCMFQSHLVIQPEEHAYGQGPLGSWRNNGQEKFFSTYALTLEVWLGSESILVSAMFDSRVLEPWVVRNMLQRLEKVMHEFDHASNTQPLADIQISTATDLEEIWERNMTVPEQVDRCVDDIINDQVQVRPNAPAICAWDGELKYCELDDLATQLSYKLIKFGITEGSLVPVCFEKSMWTTVAILGVLKAGAGFVLLDPTLPEQRLSKIAQQVKTAVIICSLSHQALCSRLAAETLPLSWDLFSNLQSNLIQPTQPAWRPKSSTIVYVIFTSGSTGTPKGVMISHSNAASALKHQLFHTGLSSTSRLFDFASYSFDVAINNVFTILAAGGCLCVPSEDDRKNNLERSIVSLRANALDLTPSVARLLSPARLPGVRSLTLGGEPLRAADIKHWYGKVRICNAYGPSECTPTSTVNHGASSPELATHIGKGAGLVTWIVDPENHNKLLPPGCTGELLLEGPLVGCGYLGEVEKTASAFIENPLWLLQGLPGRTGRHGRLYKTGDLVKYNQDGSLIFVQRKDAQVKIRGQRIELEEIEHVLSQHDLVDDAIAVLQSDGKKDSWIAGFVTIKHRDDAQETQPGSDDEAKQQITSWEDQFDGDTYSSIQKIQPKTLGKDFIGWDSMYDGSKIDIGEMNEWLDDTLSTIVRSGSFDNVLEIGTGSGMILFNLVDRGLKSYVGVEPSAKAVDFVARTAKSIPHLKDAVRVYKATASDILLLDTPLSPEMVILNSVIQYFPSQEYLFKVIEDVLRLPSVKTIFFGDVRSYSLHEEFLALRALHITGENVNKEEFRRVLANLKRTEPELLLDPGFFTSLPDRLPDHIDHVEILPKRMKATNELSCYRFTAVLHVKSQNDTPEKQQAREVNQESWIDYSSHEFNRQSLSSLLNNESASATIAFSNIPHSKTVVTRDLIQSLECRGVENGYDYSWVSTVRENAQHSHSLSAIDLAELAHQSGFEVEISWARQFSGHGSLDAVFHRNLRDTDGRRTLFCFPTDHLDRPYHSLSSQPLRQQVEARIRQELETQLRKQLASYMVPQTVTVLERMPVTKNGKIDRRALTENIQTQTSRRRVKRPPTTDVEKKIQEIWSNVLHIDRNSIGLDDGFVQLGGNSLGAMKVVTLARQAGIDLTVADMFRHATTSIEHLLQPRAINRGTGQISTLIEGAADLMAEIARHDTQIASVQAEAEADRSVSKVLEKTNSHDVLNVLLTGANGFIGTQILRQLLEHGRVGRVIAVVRGESAENARQRTIDAAKQALWWTEFHEEILEVWSGDLSMPHLGLEPQNWRLVADGRTIDVIIHNGASVHFMKSYEALEAANVRSTVEMLSVAARNPRMRFVYVSSARSRDPAEEQEEDVAKELTEDPNGYNQTKFVAETLVKRAAFRSSSKNNQFAVVSPGLVIGTPTEGVANADDWVWRMVAACIRVGVYNGENSHKWIPMADAAATATAIIDAALDYQSNVVTQVRGGMTWGDFWTTLTMTGYHLTAKSADECSAAISNDIRTSKDSHPLWALADMLESLEDTTKAQWANSWCKNGVSPVRLKVALRKSAQFLSKVGFLPSPMAMTEPDTKTTTVAPFVRSAA